MSLPSGLGAGGRGKEKQPCRYLHYEVDWDEKDVDTSRVTQKDKKKPYRIGIGMGPNGKDVPVASIYCTSHIHMLCLYCKQLPPQWLNCDLRRFDYSVLGKFHVIMADPPWDIHMSVRSLNHAHFRSATLIDC